MRRAETALAPSTPVAALAGIGPRRAEMLSERAIVTVEDLILHLPARYQDWRNQKTIGELSSGMTAVVAGTLGDVRERPMPGAPWRRLVSASLADDAGAKLGLVWFNLPSYMRERMPEGRRVAAYGRISDGPDGKIQMLHPEIRADSTDGGPAEPIRPVYRLAAAMPHRLYAGLVWRALAEAAPGLKNAIPPEVRDAAGLPSLGEALAYLHMPPAEADLDALAGGRSEAHAALAIDELFAFELAMCVERERAARRPGFELGAPPSLSAAFIERVPFTLTAAQDRALREIGRDLESARQMNRILIGDVGSGKTAVAFWAILRAVESGAQAAMMAPTELLAEQHHQSFLGLCSGLGVRSELLSGRVTGAARAAVLRDLGRGRLAVVFGTQALFQEPVRIARLGLGVIDEQHRFGVFDRARLKALGPKANVLMMTATPIPRSLAMTMFANLDVSALDEMPPGRAPVETAIFTEEELGAVDEIVRSEIARGRRAYYVVPLIDDDDNEEVKSVAAMAARLRSGALKHARVGTLHGRMRPLDKDRVMRQFRDGQIDVLVSTTVVEVGIDVADATAIVIVGAERYGLAQLHQLRGRVGRGTAPSRCCLVVSRDADEAAHERLQVLARCAGGAEVAEADLAMRGPGDLLGARQTGAIPLRFARFISDPAMIRRAREMAEQWMERDPGLLSAASDGAQTAMRRMMAAGFSLADVG
jgi:ATP-dependent DNA helicase RecG